MKNLRLVILCLCMTLTMPAKADELDNKDIWQVLQFQGGATYKYYKKNNVPFATYEYCGIGFCNVIEGQINNQDIEPLLAVSYLILAYIDDDIGVSNWFHISPMAFALTHVDKREHILRQWQPNQCDQPKLAKRVVCTLRFLVNKHQLKYAFVRYDEGLRNTNIESWDKYLTEGKFTNHERQLKIKQKELKGKQSDSNSQ